MTLRADNPWADVLQRQAADITRRIESRHPDLTDVSIAAVGRSVWAAGPESVDPFDVMWRIAAQLAELWPGWLADLDVSLVVTSGSAKITASAGVMAAFASGELDPWAWRGMSTVTGLA